MTSTSLSKICRSMSAGLATSGSKHSLWLHRNKYEPQGLALLDPQQIIERCVAKIVSTQDQPSPIVFDR